MDLNQILAGLSSAGSESTGRPLLPLPTSVHNAQMMGLGFEPLAVETTDTRRVSGVGLAGLNLDPLATDYLGHFST